MGLFTNPISTKTFKFWLRLVKNFSMILLVLTSKFMTSPRSKFENFTYESEFVTIPKYIPIYLGFFRCSVHFLMENN